MNYFRDEKLDFSLGIFLRDGSPFSFLYSLLSILFFGKGTEPTCLRDDVFFTMG